MPMMFLLHSWSDMVGAWKGITISIQLGGRRSPMEMEDVYLALILKWMLSPVLAMHVVII
jgi:hypothetical protein